MPFGDDFSTGWDLVARPTYTPNLKSLTAPVMKI